MLLTSFVAVIEVLVKSIDVSSHFSPQSYKASSQQNTKLIYQELYHLIPDSNNVFSILHPHRITVLL